MRRIALAVLTALPIAAQAQLYSCLEEDGRKVIRNQPCPTTEPKAPERQAPEPRGYGNYDARRILTMTETPAGKRGGIDMRYLDRMLEGLASGAANYPPKFSEQDAQRAARDARTVAGMLDILVKDPNAHPEILFRAASVNAIAHNLSVPGAAEKASVIYQRLLALQPENPRANFQYGAFLGNTGRFRESVGYLEKAFAAGNVNAAYSLGLAHLALEDKDKALRYLETYQARGGQADVSTFVNALRSGQVEIRRTGQAPASPSAPAARTGPAGNSGR
jgi:tetratricopeptide (TPR) repeat protein